LTPATASITLSVTTLPRGCGAVPIWQRRATPTGGFAKWRASLEDIDTQ
jgi:hypothetical protein